MNEPKQRHGFMSSLLAMDDPDITVRRVRRNTLIITALLAIAVAVVTRSAWQVAGLTASAVLMLLNFQGLVAVSDTLIGTEKSSPGVLAALFLTGRYVLLGILLCGIVLLPGVGPIPVALGLSVLVLAILLEAILQVSSGAHRPS